MSHREYHYVGPSDVREIARTQPPGLSIQSASDIAAWLETNPTEQLPDGSWVATFTVGTDQVLYLAPRRSEHVACASGGPVLSAGEITINDHFNITEISNQSTGFCPEPESWIAVETTLDRLALHHPGKFTNAVIFRRCPECKERNIVKDSWFHCLICNAELPDHWNFSDAEIV